MTRDDIIKSTIDIPTCDWAYALVKHHRDGNHANNDPSNVWATPNYIHTYIHALIQASKSQGIDWQLNESNISKLLAMPYIPIGCANKTKANYLIYDDTAEHTDSTGKHRNGNMVSREYLLGGIPFRHEKPLYIPEGNYVGSKLWGNELTFMPYYFYTVDGVMVAHGLSFETLCYVFGLDEKGN